MSWENQEVPSVDVLKLLWLNRVSYFLFGKEGKDRTAVSNFSTRVPEN